MHRGNDPAIPRFQQLFRMLWSDADKRGLEHVFVAAARKIELQAPRRLPTSGGELSQGMPRGSSVRVRQTTSPAPSPTQFNISTPECRLNRGRSNSRGRGSEKHKLVYGSAPWHRNCSTDTKVSLRSRDQVDEKRLGEKVRQTRSATNTPSTKRSLSLRKRSPSRVSKAPSLDAGIRKQSLTRTRSRTKSPVLKKQMASSSDGSTLPVDNERE